MTDTTTAKKRVIRSRARRFAMDLHDAPLDSGLELYQSTINELYDGKARIRICLKCGDIEASANLNTSNHKCALDFKSFQVVVATNWLKLEGFFLTEKYNLALQKIGVELGEREVVTIPVETKAEVPSTIPEKASVKAGIEGNDTGN